MKQVLTHARVFDGVQFQDHSVGLEDGRITDDPGGSAIDFGGDILCPRFVDLQVNGGGGKMLGDAATEADLARIVAAHRKEGTGALFPTLITDSPDNTARIVDLVAASELPEIAGLHLEGPHIAAAKRGAHDEKLVRRMEDADLDLLLAAAKRIKLIVTLAPEAVSAQQVGRLADAGITVSLGHTETDFETARAYFEAGARMVTHLFNAMAPLHHRAPGLAGAAMLTDVHVGLIGDGLHVHPVLAGMAFRTKGASQLCLVTDAMAPFGSGMTHFELNGRKVAVDGTRLSLADGTLAGANTSMLAMIRKLVNDAEVPLEAALQAATGTPARALGLGNAGDISPGTEPLRIAADLSRIKPLLG